MAGSGFDPVVVPAGFWGREDVAASLRDRDFAALFVLLRRMLGASQFRIGLITQIGQHRVSMVMNRKSKITSLELMERVAAGLGMPDHARALLGLAPVTATVSTVTEPLPAMAAGADGDLWVAADLLARLHARDGSQATIEALAVAAERLCCEYRWRPAADLRDEALGWLREVLRLRGSVALRAQRDLLSIAGWLGALVGCVEYDLGRRSAAEATRSAVVDLAHEAGNAEVLAWTYEMAAWFALTQSRLADAAAAAEAGRAVAGERGVSVQLYAQEARARARLGDLSGVHRALDRGRALLDRLPRPDRPENHFVIDPDKWDFYAMDAFRLVADDEHASHHAREVIRLGAGPDGADRAPMRVAEAQLTLGVVAVRAGELEQAVGAGVAGLRSGRRSLPSLLMVGGELHVEITRRYPRERLGDAYQAALRAVTPTGPPPLPGSRGGHPWIARQ